MRQFRNWLLVGLLLIILAFFGWQTLLPNNSESLSRVIKSQQYADTAQHDEGVLTQRSLLTSPLLVSEKKTEDVESFEVAQKQKSLRLANTEKSLDDLVKCETAILLKNALIDTKEPLTLDIPDGLKAGANPGCYLVQSREPLTQKFYDSLDEQGIEVVSYIPNNAVLVSMSAEQAELCSERYGTVLPYHPYYKLDSSLLKVALDENSEPYKAGTFVQIAVAPNKEEEFFEELSVENLPVIAKTDSIFGKVVVVQPSQEQVVTLAQSANTHLLSVCYPKVLANDLSMKRVEVATTAENKENYLGLTGSNVFFNINDAMIDTNHPALRGRISFGQDTNGNLLLPIIPEDMAHGTHVIGTILGNGAESDTVGTNASGSVEGVSFKGAATNAHALYLPYDLTGISESGKELVYWAAQSNYVTMARSNVLISHNSWNFSNAEYDLSAAEYDSMVRDAMPDYTGMQPVLLVFSAGNEGYGDNEGGTGDSDTILSPATAKNVITVGALESARNISVNRTNIILTTNVVDDVQVVTTNYVVSTNSYLYEGSDDDQQVASYSSRGNVGIGEEGELGRIKPDVVATGSFVVSTKGTNLDWEIEIPETYTTTKRLKLQALDSFKTNNYAFFGPTNLVSFTIEIKTNVNSGGELPPLQLFVSHGYAPKVSDYVGNDRFTTNFPSIYATEDDEEEDEESGDGSEEMGWSEGFGDWYYSVANISPEMVYFDIVLTMELAYPEEDKEYYEDLAAANKRLGDYYRYESGTSMSAAAVSGMLILLQDFFSNYSPAGVTNPSPALMKALLINGANPVSTKYSRKEAYGLNHQGWGLPNMTNMLPASLTNGNDAVSPIYFVDQCVENALGTGESWERVLKVPAGATPSSLKVTLVWTDPPGNPSAGIKLVNDLDLVVSNVVTKAVYYGNDIPVNQDYNTPRGGADNTKTNNVSAKQYRDSVNNVESVIIKGTLDTNYVISVQARRINVNAVTAHTNGIVQDFALVVSFQNPLPEMSTTNAVEVKIPTDEESLMGTNIWVSPIDMVTNSVALLKQRVGANSPIKPIDEIYTNGYPSQWHFYVFTNTWWIDTTANIPDESVEGSADSEEDEGDDDEEGEEEENRQRVGGQYVAFSTFLPPNLSIPTRQGQADIDLYVSTNSAITNLDADVIDEAVRNNWVSRNVGSNDEMFYLTNALENEVFYIGIKAEDQKAAEYAFVGISRDTPFDSDDNGNRVVYFNPGNAWVPDGSPEEPGGTYLFGIVTRPMTVGNVIITNYYMGENIADLYISLDHGVGGSEDSMVVLHNHSFLSDTLDPVVTNLIEVVYNDNTKSTDEVRHSDGPGSLNNFMNYQASGLWYMTLVDDALNHTNRVSSGMYIIPYSSSASILLDPLSYEYRAVDVTDDVVAIKVAISDIEPNATLEFYAGKEYMPTWDHWDYGEVIDPPGRVITISRDDIPPLENGRYWLAVYNPNRYLSVSFKLEVELVYGFTVGNADGTPSENTPLILKDDSCTVSYTNWVKPTEIEDAAKGDTNLLAVISDSVISISDDRKVKNVNVGVRIDHPRISDLAFYLQSPKGTRVLLSENRGWNATNAAPNETKIIPNEKNNSVYGTGTTNEDSKITYAFFSSDTNYLLTPIKFAVPPFTFDGKGENLFISDFEDLEESVYNIETNTLLSGNFEWLLTPSTNKKTISYDEGSEIVVVTNEVPVTNFIAWVRTETNATRFSTNILIANRAVLTTQLTGLEADTNYNINITFKKPTAIPGLITWWRANNDYLDSEWNVPMFVANGEENWLGFETNGIEGEAFGFANTHLIAPATNMLSTISNNFSFDGWFRLDNVTLADAWLNGKTAPKMPLFEFSQTVTNTYTNVVIDVEGNEVEEIFTKIEHQTGTSAWINYIPENVDVSSLPATINTQNPWGVLSVCVGENSQTKEPIWVVANLIGNSANPLPYLVDWMHLAVLCNTDKNSTVVNIYYNGELVSEQELTSNDLTTRFDLDFNLGYGTIAIEDADRLFSEYQYQGLMDELSWFDRSLEPWEIGELVWAGKAGFGKAGISHPPTSTSSAAKVTLRQVGSKEALLSANLPEVSGEWQIARAHFKTPAKESTETESDEDSEDTGEEQGEPVEPEPVVYELIIDVSMGVMAFDDIAISTMGQAYQPEDSLSVLTGENTLGDWSLIVYDTRVGATNPVPQLLSWTLDLGYNPESLRYIDLTETNNYSYSGKLEDDNKLYFRVFVPGTATIATNELVANDNMLLSGRWTGVPKFEKGIDDYYWPYLTPGVSNYVISTNITSQAPLIPGGRYYLALRNLGMYQDTSFDLSVKFNSKTNDVPEGVVTLTDRNPYTVNPDIEGQGINMVDYYRFVVGDSAGAVQFLAYEATTNLTMVVSKDLPLPTLVNYNYIDNQKRDGYAQVYVLTNSAPVALSAGDWYVGVYNGGYKDAENYTPISYKIVAIQYNKDEIYPNPSTLTSGRPVTDTLKPGEVRYYLYSVTDEALSLWHQLNLLDGKGVNLYTKFGLPLPNSTNSLYQFEIEHDEEVPSTVNWEWWLSKGNEYPLRAGEWYYAVENDGSENVTYNFRVTEFSIDPQNIIWLKNGVSSTNTVGITPSQDESVYYGFDVSTNAVGGLFELFNEMNGSIDMFVMPGIIPDPNAGKYWYTLQQGMENKYLRLSAWSGDLTVGYWFLAAKNSKSDMEDSTAATYQVRASVMEAPDEENMLNLVNGYTVRTTDTPMYYEDYFHYSTVTEEPVSLSFTINNVSDLVNVYLLTNSPVKGSSLAVQSLQWVSPWPFGTGMGVITLGQESLPPLEKGDWYIVVENASYGSVSYDLTAQEAGVVVNDRLVPIGIDYDSETGTLTLIWESEVGETYDVRGTASIATSPIVWDVMDSVVAKDTISRYTLSKEEMEKYSFFSVRRVSQPTVIPVDLTTYISCENERLTLHWKLYSADTVYLVEGKEDIGADSWNLEKRLVSNLANPWQIYEATEESFSILRINPESGVSATSIQTAASYDAEEGIVTLYWDAIEGVSYQIRGWTNCADSISLNVETVVASGDVGQYSLKLGSEKLAGCQYFTVAYRDKVEVIEPGIGRDGDIVTLAWASVKGNAYRVEGKKEGATWETVTEFIEPEGTHQTIVATEERLTVKFSVSDGSGSTKWNFFRVVALGKSQDDPEDPEKPEVLDLEFVLLPDENMLVLSWKAIVGEQYVMEYCSTLGDEDGWSENEPVEADREQMSLKIPLTEEGRFFRLRHEK